MKSVCRLIAVAILLSGFSKVTLGQWEQTDGPGGGDVLSMHIKDSIVFIGTHNGVYTSKVNEARWSLSGLVNNHVSSLLENNGTVYARVSRDTLFKTKDNGKTWLPSDSVSDRNFYAFLQYKGKVYSVFDGYGVYQSGDSGTTWELVPGFAYNVGCLAVSKDTLFAGFNKGIFSRTEKSNDWTLVDTSFFRKSAVTSIEVCDDVIFAIVEGGYVCWSTDNGRTFKSVDAPVFQSPVYNNQVYDLLACNGTIFAATIDSGVCQSKDNGISWNTVNTGIQQKRYIANLAKKGDTLFEASGSGGGVYRSIDNGANWTEFNYGLNIQEIQSLAVCGEYIYAATPGGVYRSRNNGDSWTQVNSGLENVDVSLFATSGDYIFAGSSSLYPERGVYLSSDSGEHWKSVNYGLSPPVVEGISHVHSLATTENGILYAGTAQYGLHISTDSGSTWKQLPEIYSGITSLAVDGSSVFAGSSGFERLFISRDYGASVVITDVNNKKISSILISGDRVLVGSNEGNVFLSDDWGVTWKESRLSERRILNVNVLTRSGKDTVFAGTDNYGISVSTDNGTSWTAVNSGLIDSCILSLVIKEPYLFAGTKTKSVWRRQLSEIVASKEQCTHKFAAYSAFSIYFQKPINKTVSFSFTLPLKTKVSANVYNAAGQKMATLIMENLPAGKHTRKWNAKKLYSGVYFCNFKTELFSATRMFVLN